MKKGIWILVLFISLALIAVGCSEGGDGEPQGNDTRSEDLENDLDLGDNADDSDDYDEDNDADDLYSGSRPMPDVIEEVEDPFERMRESLEEFVEYVNRPYDIDAEYYGAESAKRFGLDDGSIMLYAFSPDSDGLRRLYETGMLVAEGRSTGTPALYHDNIAMELDIDNEELRTQIIELFESL